MEVRVVILVCDTLSRSVSHNCKYDNVPKGFQVMKQKRICIWNNQGEITQKVWKWELSFLYMTHHYDLFYITVNYHDNIPYDIQVMAQKRNCIWNHQGEITQKVWKQELSFLYAKHRHDLFYITVKYHGYIPKGGQVTERTQRCSFHWFKKLLAKVCARSTGQPLRRSKPVQEKCS